MDLHRYKARLSLGSGYEEKYEPLGTLVVIGAMYLGIGLITVLNVRTALGFTSFTTLFAYLIYWQASRFPILIGVGCAVSTLSAISFAVSYVGLSCPDIEGLYEIPWEIRACYDSLALYSIWFWYSAAFMVTFGYYLLKGWKRTLTS